MLSRNLLQYVAFVALVTLLVKPLGLYLTRVFEREPTRLDRFLVPLERRLHRWAGVDTAVEMTWQQYATAYVVFALLGTLWIGVVLMLQPLGQPGGDYSPGPPGSWLSLGTAVSFATTTTWQAYGGESTLSYLSQTVALVSQNFLAGASGLAVGIAFVRGFARREAATLGNFWVDVIRAMLWVLLPIAIVGAVLLIAEGVPQNWSPYVVVRTVEGARQVIAEGPVASLEFIKNLGSNGGGFFATNGAHPYANPTPLTNFVGTLAIVAIPAASTYTFGRMTRRQEHGWLLYGVMALLFSGGLAVYDRAEQAGNPRLAALGVDTRAGATAPGGNMEGKETRFGIGGSTLTAIATSNGATGSSNASVDSNSPLGGGILLVNMLLGEAIFGGLGTGLYSLVLTALLTVFLTGLMIGRTPAYLGKTLGINEIRLVGFYLIVAPAVVLPLTALAVVTDAGLAGLTTNTGAHGFTSIFFAYASCFANNGQAFGGLTVDTPFYHATTIVAMLAGRFGLAIPALAVAGSFARQGRRGQSAGTLPTDGALFAGLLIATMVIVGALGYLPALALGPIIEHLQW